jgi:hypothetical protein
MQIKEDLKSSIQQALSSTYAGLLSASSIEKFSETFAEAIVKASASVVGLATSCVSCEEQVDWNQTDSTKDDFIKNKPNIPTSQIQSDWNQTTTTALDYIKNKPTIGSGGGDMTKSIYDSNNDGIVDDADNAHNLGGVPANAYATQNYVTAAIGQSNSSNLNTQVIYSDEASPSDSTIDLSQLESSAIIVLTDDVNAIEIIFPVSQLNERTIKIVSGDFQVNSLNYHFNNAELFANNAQIDSLNPFQSVEYVYRQSTNFWYRIN